MLRQHNESVVHRDRKVACLRALLARAIILGSAVSACSLPSFVIAEPPAPTVNLFALEIDSSDSPPPSDERRRQATNTQPIAETPALLRALMLDQTNDTAPQTKTLTVGSQQSNPFALSKPKPKQPQPPPPARKPQSTPKAVAKPTVQPTVTQPSRRSGAPVKQETNPFQLPATTKLASSRQPETTSTPFSLPKSVAQTQTTVSEPQSYSPEYQFAKRVFTQQPTPETLQTHNALTPNSSTMTHAEIGQPNTNAAIQLNGGQIPWIPHTVNHGPYGRQLDRYRVRASETQDVSVFPPQITANNETSREKLMWWESELINSLGLSQQAVPVGIQTLTETALASSPLVQSVLTEPRIRQSDIVVADAEFDPTVFLEGRFTDTSEPIGSSLTTGDDSTRYRDETFTSVGGVRKKTRRGGELELFQRAGFQANNSQFLDPNPQGTTRLEFNFTQPLMRDGGRAVNNTRVLLAQLDLQVTNASVREKLEDHLVSVTRAYWDLYLARADWLQRKRLIDRAERLFRIMQARGGVDSQRRQILRAHAALTSRRSDLVRAETRIRDIQAQIRLLTGSQQLINTQNWELTPQDRPLSVPVEVSTQQSVVTALDNRSDIAQAIRTVQSVSARVGAARNQVLPRLDLILGSYVAGLKDRRNPLGAWVNQFDTGRPTYWAGLSYELPVANRAGNARLNRNRWELSQAMHDFKQTTEVAFTEVEVAVRETQTAYNEMLAKQAAVESASNEVEYLQQRWELLPDPNESAVLLIEDLLDAQQRLADEELAYVTAQVSYALSWIQLRKAMGVLLRFDDAKGTTIIPPTPSNAAAPSNSANAPMNATETQANVGWAASVPSYVRSATRWQYRGYCVAESRLMRRKRLQPSPHHISPPRRHISPPRRLIP